MAAQRVPDERVRALNDTRTRSDGDYVLYWMTAFHRTAWNFSLQRAVDWALGFERPLVLLDVLRCGSRWANARLYRFELDGMASIAKRLKGTQVRYYPYVETSPGASYDLVVALAHRACAVVTDDFPDAELAEQVQAMARNVSVTVEAVDSNGLLPLRAAPRVFPTAYAFRRFIQQNLCAHLRNFPKRNPLARVRLATGARIPRQVLQRWPSPSAKLLTGDARAIASLPIDHSVPVVQTTGGMDAAAQRLRGFVDERLEPYDTLRNHPDEDATSGLSPYLHFGHISAHEIFAAVMKHEGWSVDRLDDKADGRRQGWWGTSQSAEGFLDQLITWRELGYNMAWQWPDYDRYDSLPAWARNSLADHASDKRHYTYNREQFESADTHDPLWNAAQRQLVREGRLHNYLRMLWGKKILEWSAGPEEATDVMIELNNKYALDGRNPNSYSGIFWVIGRYDRAWGPERPIFGNIRYMSSDNTARKLRVRQFLQTYGS